MKYILSTIAISALSLAIGGTAFAEVTKEQVIDKVTEGYGGAKFENLKSIRLSDDVLGSGIGQGYLSGFSDYNASKKETLIDFENQRGSEETYANPGHFFFHNRATSTKDGIVQIDYVNGTVQSENSFENYYQSMGPITRSTDILLAKELLNYPERINAVKDSAYLGHNHHVVTYELPESPELTIYVNADSGLISRMARQTPFGDLNYLFKDHKSVKGISYAGDYQFFVGDRLNFHYRRDASINDVRAKEFELDKGLVAEPERVDGTEMSVDKLADNIYLVGQGGAYSVFADTGPNIIGVGAYGGLTPRFEALKEEIGSTKSLSRHIVTHHHDDHIGGVGEAYELGATLLMPEDTVAPVKARIEGPTSESRFESVSEKQTLGPFEIHPFSTRHAEQNLLVYLPANKAIFQADHYGSAYKDKVGSLNDNAVMFRDAVDALGLDVEIVLSAHGRKQESWAAFSAAVDAKQSFSCFKGRKICR